MQHKVINLFSAIATLALGMSYVIPATTPVKR